VTQQLRAGLRLDLEDKLSSGLTKLEQQMDRLVDLAKKLGLGDLERGVETLERLTGPIDDVVSGLRSTEQQADRASAAISRMAAAANESIISVNSGGVATLNRSLGQLVVLGGGGIGGGGNPGGEGVGAEAGGAPLLLTGPGGDSRIPLNLRPDRLGNLRRAGGDFFDAAHGAGSAVQNGIGQGFAGALEGAAVYEPVEAYAGFENILRHIAITEKLSGDKVAPEIKRLTQMFNADAQETSQSSESIAKAYSDLVQTGINSKIIDKVIRAHSRAATAYNISPEALGPAVGALLQNSLIPEDEIGSALAAMAQASKEGRFKVEDFSRQLPGITGQMALLGMTGRKSADIGFAALETVMKNSSEPNTAAANFFDALHYITSPIANRSFAKAGIDLPKMLKNAEKMGINPLDAVLGKLDQRTAKMTHLEKTEFIGGVLHNQQAGTGIVSLLEHKGDYLKLRSNLDKVDKTSLDTDFNTAVAAPSAQLRKMQENLKQVERQLGESFLPIVLTVASGLLVFAHGLGYMNDRFPTLTHWVLGALAGLIALAAIVTVLTAVAPVFAAMWTLGSAALGLFAAGIGALISPMAWLAGASAIFDGLVAVFGALGAVLAAVVSPIGLIIAAVGLLALAAYDVYANWGSFEPFFEQLWAGVKMSFQGFLDFAAGVFTLDMDRVWKGLGEMGGGFATQTQAMWDIVKQVFNDFTKWVDGWSGGLASRILAGISSGWSGLVDGLEGLVGRMERPFLDGWIGRHLGISEAPQLTAVPGASHAAEPQPGAGAAPAGDGRRDGLDITVSAAPGTAVHSVQTTNPDHKVTVVNPGNVLGRH
jgi:TP901 family phage tail tape measure protein